MVFIAHDLAVVRHIADRTAVMYLGRIAELGETETVYANPAHPYTRALLSASPVVDRSRRGSLKQRVVLRGEPPSPTNPPSGCRFHTRCPLRQDVCTTDVPVLRQVAGHRTAACHFAETALSSSAASTASTASTADL
jgi:oligopeptide transport system ATP-binding protein